MTTPTPTYEISRQSFRAASFSGIVYLEPYAPRDKPLSAAYFAEEACFPIGGVQDLDIDIKEHVEKQKDYSGGGGTRAEMRRVETIEISLKLQDLNTTNFSRSLKGHASDIAGMDVPPEEFWVTRGALMRTKHIKPSAVVLTKGGQIVVPDKNYTVLTEGIRILPKAPDLADGDKVIASYSSKEYVRIEAMIKPGQEYRMLFSGINEADSNNPVLLDFFRVSQGIVNKLSLIGDGKYQTLDIKGEVLPDPSVLAKDKSRFFAVYQG